MKKIHHVVDVEAPPGKVWWALTETDGLTGWWSTVLDSPGAARGTRQAWTFAGDFNPVMEVTDNVEHRRLAWHCTGGHDNWQDNDFTFELHPLGDGRTRLRFTQDYARELSDDDYGTYNFDWGYYLESLRLLCVSGSGKPFDAAGG